MYFYVVVKSDFFKNDGWGLNFFVFLYWRFVFISFFLGLLNNLII